MQAALRQNFMIFLMKVFETLHPGEPTLLLSPYLKALCYCLTRASIGDLLRLVITIPPRHLKTVTAAVALPAWLLGRDPALKIMVATYGEGLGLKPASDFRTILESSWYRELFLKTRISNRGDRQLETITTQGGVRRAITVGGAVTGLGADLIIVDDCMKSDDASSQAKRDELIRWFDGTLSTRLNRKETGRIISIQQRLHEDDLPAHLLDKGYEHLNLPAIAEYAETIATSPTTSFRREVGDLLDPERHSKDVLDRQRREMGPVAFAAQYQQSPSVPEGNLIKLDWFKEYGSVCERHMFDKIVQSWDTAATSNPNSDWSVCTTWGYMDGHWLLADLFRDRLDYPDLKRAVLRLMEVWKPHRVLIEHASTGLSLAQDLRRDGYHNITAPRIRGDKQERLIACTAELESGKFALPAEAPWLRTLESELRAFPNSKYDDQVDSLAQFVNFQKVRPTFALEEYTPSGRLVRSVRPRRSGHLPASMRA